jgi:hypothetical protein
MTMPEHTNKQRGVWSPYVLAVMVLLFSGYPALILCAINFGRYGLPKKRTFWLITTPILYLLLYTLDWISPDGMRLRGLLFAVISIWITYSQQIGLHQQWKRDRKPKAPTWLAVIISIAILVILTAVDQLAWVLLP